MFLMLFSIFFLLRGFHAAHFVFIFAFEGDGAVESVSIRVLVPSRGMDQLASWNFRAIWGLSVHEGFVPILAFRGEPS